MQKRTEVVDYYPNVPVISKLMGRLRKLGLYRSVLQILYLYLFFISGSFQYWCTLGTRDSIFIVVEKKWSTWRKPTCLFRRLSYFFTLHWKQCWYLQIVVFIWFTGTKFQHYSTVIRNCLYINLTSIVVYNWEKDTCFNVDKTWHNTKLIKLYNRHLICNLFYCWCQAT